MTAEATNRLLDQLPADYKADLLAQMEIVSLDVSESIYRPGETPKYAHFVTGGLTSVVTFMEDGNGVEVGLVGYEGLVEGMHLLGGGKFPTTGFIQVEGSALRMLFTDLKREFKECEPLRTLVMAGIQGQALVLAQLAACNRLHEVEERLARWLLMVGDRLKADSFVLTQEFLAEMLGVRRTTVTLAAANLQRKEWIEYRRGHITILDRAGLEKAACECYPIVRDLVLNLYK